MTTPEHRLPGKRTRGMALFIVLAVLLLVSVLVIGFFLSTATELKSSRSYASGAAARQHVDSVTQLVIAQIADATKGEDGNRPLAWASQPGMIRTYDDSGQPFKYYKLYSSDSLILDSGAAAGFNTGNEAPPPDWNTQTGLFTDLNSPIVRDGKVHFPIIDPRAKSSTAAQSVEGFDYTAGVQGVVLPGAAADSQRLPMPVRWIYVLQDGKLATPKSSSGGVGTFDNTDTARVPSKDNPIVGRIAFWTDDDTSKININTASEGTFWDRPWANTTTEQNFATAIPGQNEFQRYPGHPAKTSLSTVLGSLLPAPTSSAWYFGISSATQTQNQDRLKAYYDLAPRVADGGTRGGTINETDATGSPNSAFKAITPDSDRLYATVDEFLFSPAFSSTRTLNNTAIDNAAVEKVKFFLTAHSRAPELNLFGKPRMTLWPLQMSTAERNAKDKLIAFCSQIGGYAYYFQRFNSYTSDPTGASSQSAVLDWTKVPRNQTLYTYLDDLTSKSIPGFGGNFATKYPHSRRQILTEMFDQIRSGVNAYSTGLSPQYSYAPSYLQSGEGQVVPLMPTSGAAAGTHGFGRFPTIIGASMVFFRTNAAYFSSTNGKIVTDDNLKNPANPQGVVIKPAPEIGATLILNPFTVSPGFPPWSPNVQYVVTGLDKFTISGTNMGFPAILKNTVTSRAEYSGQANCGPFFGLLANFRYAGAGGDINKKPGTGNPESEYAFTIPIPPGTGFKLPDGAQTFDFNIDSDTNHAITITIYAGSDTALANPIQKISMVFPPVPKLPVPTSQPTEGAVPSSVPQNRYFDRFNEGTSPTTALGKPWRQRMIQFSTTTTIQNSAGDSATYLVRDVARGVQADPNPPASGDYRVYAALPEVPTGLFIASPGYDSIGDGQQMYGNVQSLWDGGLDGGGVGGFGYDAAVGGYYSHFPMDAAGSLNTKSLQLITSFTTGILIPRGYLAAYAGVDGRGSHTGDIEYRGSARPAVPTGLNGAYLSGGAHLGDWDNATGLLGDGPFINKPDEGNSDTVSDTSSRANLDVYYGSKEIAGGYFSTGILRNVNTSYEYATETGKTFSPNRQVASAVLFGSLPTGIDPTNTANTKPWQTLAFSPNPLAKSSHPGLASPPDHLFLDLFTMPIVEPYAISEPFSTAGKVNMNYQIVPFNYIRRDTGLRAVLKASRLMAIPQGLSTVSNLGNSYKDGQRAKYELRYDINPDKDTGTLKGFENRFSNNDIFRSASEICGIFLVPKQITNLSQSMSYPPGSTPPASYDATEDWWDNFMLTGDNTREAPYGDIYARLTTKSNTYTIHYKVQALAKVPTTNPGQWVEGRDNVTGETRGSTTVERYIDLGNPNLPDFANPASPSAESFYKIRTIGSTIFNP